MQNSIQVWVCIIVVWCWTRNAFAHSGETISGGIVSGLTHPIFGWDHVAAMVAVGLWGAVLGKPSVWVLPIAFPVVMSIGASLGVLGATLPFTEVGIALSGVALGLLVVFFVKIPLVLAAVLVGMFAVFHGHAHGTELPDAVDPAAYVIGFVISTGLLHGTGILLGTVAQFGIGNLALRLIGLSIALGSVEIQDSQIS